MIHHAQIFFHNFDSSALNFNPNATSDNGSCKYEGVIESVSKKYYIWSSTANIKWKLNGQIQTPVNGKMYDSFNIKHDVGSIKWTNDVREVPKPDKIASTRMYIVKNSNNLPLLTKPYPKYNDIANYYGQNQLGTDSYNNNYGAGKTVSNPWYDTTIGVPLSVTYKDAVGNTKTSSNLLPGDTTTICAQRGSISKGPGIVCIELGPCVTQQPTPKPPVVIIKPTPPRPKPKPIPRPAPPKPRPKPIQISRGGSGSGSGGNNNNEFLNYDYGNDRGMGRNNGNGREIVLRRGRNPRML